MITNIYILAAFGTIGGALFGFDISSMSAFIGARQYTTYFDYPDSTLQGGITASMSGGSFLGALGAGFLADRLGRKGALQVACLVFTLGCAIVCSAQNVGQLIAGRIVNGLAIGVCSSQVCVYLAELAPGRIRGRIVGIQQWAIEWGILIMYLISYGCITTLEGTEAFRIPWGVQGIPAVVLFGALFFFPESPRWMAKNERWEECHDVLARLHGNGDLQHPEVILEMEEVRQAQKIAAESKDLGFFGLFGPKIWKRTLAGTSVQMWQQLLGGNVALYYTVYIFEMAGLSGNANLTSSIIQYVIFLVTTGGILPIVDRIGRRKLLLTGAIICMTIHYTVAGVMATYGVPQDEVLGNPNLRLSIAGAPGKAVIALSFIFTGIYGLTWAPIGWVYCSEVFPLTYRAKGVALSAATNWAFNFALAYFLPPAFTNITWKVYIIFGLFCTVMIGHIYFMYPETSRRSLEEIDVLFDSNIPAWKSSKVTSQDLGIVARAVDNEKEKEILAQRVETV